MELRINTKDQKKVSVSLLEEEQEFDSLVAENEFGSQVLLTLIDRILKKNKLSFRDLSGIEVEAGPGSFTGLRVGVSVANALGFALNIPVNGKKIETDLLY